VTAVEDRGGRLVIRADAETVSRAGRTFEIVREPLRRKKPVEMDDGRDVKCRYVVLGADGGVVLAGVLSPGDDGTFTLDLQGKVAAGVYTVMVAADRGGNFVNPSVTMVQHRVRP